MRICIHNVLPEWVENLRMPPSPAVEANLWRQDVRDFKFDLGGRVYFKINDESWRIVGRGVYFSFRLCSVEEAWSHFGDQNGCYSLDEFLDMINDRTDRLFVAESIIGCILIRSIDWMHVTSPFILPPHLWPRGPGIELCKYYSQDSMQYIESEFEKRIPAQG